MSKKIEMVGCRFGKWLVVKNVSQAKWECLCDCGTRRIVDGHSLRRGLSKSCGCWNLEVLKKAKKHGMCRTPTYDSWIKMISRCNNPKDSDYKAWGGRGIKVCKRWLKFENFFVDMGLKPKKLTLDRINNEGNYKKINCRWATSFQQARNQRIKKSNTSGVKGVYFSKEKNKWVSRITANYKRHHLGCFPTLQKATEARKKAELKYWSTA